MISGKNKNNHFSWLVVSLLSASSRILETVSMILPVKAVFVLMKPDIVPANWFSLGFTISDLMIIIMVLVMFSLLSGRVLHVVAQRKARELHVEGNDEELDRKALITTKISAALVVMIIFAGVIVYVKMEAFLLIFILVSISSIRWSLFMSDGAKKVFSLLGIAKDEMRVRFVSQLLFLIYFMCLLIVATQQVMEITISLLLVMLVGRRFFGELTRFRRALLQKKRAITLGLDDD